MAQIDIGFCVRLTDYNESRGVVIWKSNDKYLVKLTDYTDKEPEGLEFIPSSEFDFGDTCPSPEFLEGTIIVDENSIYEYVDPTNSEVNCLLQAVRYNIQHLQFRRMAVILWKNGFKENDKFYYGFTHADNLLHGDYEYSGNMYYQNGDYNELMLREGSFDFYANNWNHSTPSEKDSLICGLVEVNEVGTRYRRWFYASDAFYKLWLLLMYGHNYYVFKHMSKEEILNSLGRDIYRAYAHVIYYNEDIPSEYKLDGLREQIEKNYVWY